MGTVYGYARISTSKQSIDRQIRNIKAAYPEAVIVQEAYTGTKQDRPVWNRLQQQVKAGDMIVFDSVSRLSRTATEGFENYEKLYNQGVSLVFLKEHHIDTETYRNTLKTSLAMTNTNVDFILDGINKYLMALAKEQIRLAFEQSEKEVTDLRQRTKEGIETARINGKQIGTVKGSKLNTKKSISSKEVIKKHSKEFGGSLSDIEVMSLTGLSRNTYYKYKKEIKQEYE